MKSTVFDSGKERVPMEIVTRNNITAAVVGKGEKVTGVQQALDIMASAVYACDCTGVVFYKESLGENFFDLKTGYAGEILQKFSTYKMKIAIIGDFSVYKSRSLRDFIYESNNGNCAFFVKSMEAAFDALGR